MRKKIIDEFQQKRAPLEGSWLDLEPLAQVEVTAEDTAFPIEGALTGKGQTGWRSSKPGLQTIRIIFDEPQQIKRIHLLFEEEQEARTQEFVLRWSPATGQTDREIVRQQYNFSPGSSTQEQENYTVNLEGVKVLELNILPDIKGGNARASLSKFRLA